MSTTVTTRPQVLKLYKAILRFGKSWTSASGNPRDTLTERIYIRSEAQSLFKQNVSLSDPKAVQDCIHEAQARMDLANHYKTPYPRPVNVPPHALAQKKGKEQGKFQERLKKQSIPVYIKSHFDRR